MLPTDDLAASESRRIDHDLLCSSCNYNLRGLSGEASCPECGRAVHVSVRALTLEFSSALWLTKLRRGMNLAIVSVAAGICVKATISTVLLGTSLPLLSSLLIIVAPALNFWAVLLLTSQEPWPARQDSSVSMRRALRAMAVISVIGALLTAATPWGVPWVWLRIAAGFRVFAFAQQLVLLAYLRRFAMRAHNEALANGTTIVVWGLTISVLFASSLAMIDRSRAALWGMNTIGALNSSCASSTLTVVTLGLGVWYVVLLVQYRGLFQHLLWQLEAVLELNQRSPENHT